MEQIVQLVPSLGNTSSSSKAPKQVSPSKYWAWTWCNYPDDWVVQLDQKFFGLDGWIGGREICPDTGTPHIQGYLESDEKIRPLCLNAPKGIHYQKRIKSAEKNIAYCAKDGDFEARGTCIPKAPKISMNIEAQDIMTFDELYAWAQRLIEKVREGLPTMADREILWKWSEEGQRHKTAAAGYLVYHHNAVILQGARKHILAVAMQNPAPIYILAIPKIDEGRVSYESLELLKDAIYMSGFGVNATGMVHRKKSWVIVMANFKPETDLNGRMNVEEVKIDIATDDPYM